MYDDIIGPPCQVPYNTLLWGKKSPSNMTGAGGWGWGLQTALLLTHNRAQLSKMSK